MTAIENGEAIKNCIDVCNQVGAVCRIVMTLKTLRMEDRGDDPDADIAGSAVRKYAAEFSAAHSRRAAEERTAADAAGATLTAAADPRSDSDDD